MPSEQKLNILVAYPYMTPPVQKILMENQGHIRFVLDSGAFTAWKAGKTIALDDYCRFIESLPFAPWRYFTLDVIGDPHASMQNYETMLKRGFKPVPIFTRGEDPSVLDDYYKTSDVVGIGGLVGTGGNKGFVNWIMRSVGKRQVHWLGFTNIDYLKHYRPYMCDSSTWEAGARYGVLKVYAGGGKFISIKKADFKRKPSQAVLSAITRLGFKPLDLATMENWHGGPSISRTLCAASAVAMSLDIEQNIGTKAFLAVAATEGLGMLVNQFFKQIRQG